MDDMQGLLQQEHCQLYSITYLMWAHIFTPVQGAFLSVKMFPVHPSVRTRSSRGWKYTYVACMYGLMVRKAHADKALSM